MPDRLPVFLWHLGRRGGGPRYTLELARELARRDDVELHLGLSRQSELYAETCALGLPTLSIDTYNGISGFLTGFGRVPGIARQMASYIRQHRLSVALCTMAHLWNTMLVPSMKRAGAANCLVVHDATPHSGDNYGVRHLMIARDIRQADAVVTLSEAVRDQVIAHYGYPADRLLSSSMGPFRYGPDQERQPRRLGQPPYRLLCFGRLRPYKGIENLIEAMDLLHSRNVPVQLRIVGEGNLDLPALPPSVTVERRWVAEDEIPALFADADLIVLPYRQASQSGVVPIAHHLGIPALVTPVGGLLEQVGFGTTGFVAAGTTSADLADAIQAALADGEAYTRMSAAALADDSDTQWAHAADSLVEALKRFTAPIQAS